MKTKRSKNNGVLLSLKKRTVADLTGAEMVSLMAGKIQIVPVAATQVNCPYTTDTVCSVPTQETGITPPPTYFDDDSKIV